MPPPSAPPDRDKGILREWRIIEALDGTEVPHTAAVGVCDDPAVLGRPFYLMGFVDGCACVLSRCRPLMGLRGILVEASAGEVPPLLAPSLIKALLCANANGGPAANRPASSSTNASISSTGVTQVTRPSACASRRRHVPEQYQPLGLLQPDDRGAGKWSGHMTMPPSTGSTRPVTWEAALEAKKKPPAVASGSAQRCNGIRC